MKRLLSILIAVMVMAAPMGAFAEGDSGHTISKDDIHISITETTKVYTGYVQRPVVKVYYINDNGKKIYLKEGKDYKKTWVKRTGLSKGQHTCAAPVNYIKGYDNSTSNHHYLRVKITLLSPVSGTLYKNCTMDITKASQPVKFSKTSATVKYSKYFTKKVKMTYTPTKQKGTAKPCFVNNTGKVTLKKVSGSSKLYLDNKGNIKVKKGTKKGTYKIKIKATAKQMRDYKTTSTTKTVTVKVK